VPSRHPGCAQRCSGLAAPVLRCGVQLSKRGEYALRVLLDLTIARSLGVAVVPVPALATAQNIPAAFLEQILVALRQAGHLSATRGKHGGYSVAPSATTQSVGSLIRFLDGPLAPICCASVSAYKRCSCPDEERCGLRQLMVEARAALSSVLDGITLSELAERTLARYRADGVRPALIDLLDAPRKTSRGGEPEYLI
jgi:Rrf2 family protein